MKRVNLIYYNNGVGLTKHVQIFKSLLNGLFTFIDCEASNENCPKSDINVFFQTIDINTIKFISKAKKNILIPCIEWMFQDNLNMLSNIDLILTTCQYSKSILDNYHRNVIYMGFTSLDKYNPLINKIPNSFLHVAGKSIQKNTELVVNVFNELKLPITIVDINSRFLNKTSPNIKYITEFLPEKEFNELLNLHQTHICCSFTEGWGHYIYEALSCKSLVVTTDCPPANELLTNEDVFFIKSTDNIEVKSILFNEEQQYPLRKLIYTDKKDLIKTIKNISFLSTKTINDIKNNARNSFLSINNKFLNKKDEIYKLLNSL